jgi:transporter, major facilitator family
MVYLGVAAVISSGIGLLFELGLSLSLITALIGCMFFAGAIYWISVRKIYKDELA